MHGLGNDFIMVNAIRPRIKEENLTQLAETLCDRHFGIGADGLILVEESDHSDFKMRVINSDGSEPEMCGNGIRCFAKYVYEHELTKKEVISVETLAGVMVPGLIIHDNKVVAVEVDMGEPILEPSKVPVQGFSGDKVVNEPISVGGQEFNFTAVSMGNPHAVIFTDNLKEILIEELGPQASVHEAFPNQVNAEFVQVLNENEAVMIVWERGAGETLACGTGACATLVAGVLNKKFNRKALIHLPGGDLSIEWLEDNNHVIMTGPATTVFSGEIQVFLEE